jgi:ribosomal protein S18 acetylase RimI-like enzyme
VTHAPAGPARPASAITVKPATVSDVSTVAGILADSFQDDRVFAWCIPDEGRRAASIPAFFELFVRTVGGTGGEMYLSTGGAALWVPPGKPARPAEREAEFGAAAAAVLGEDAERTFRLMGAMEEHHPAAPHYYLPFVGVHRAHQGRGIGSALLRTVLDRCDEHGIPAYLEATSEDNRRLYERHGFAVTREIAVDDSPPLYAMWREPSK